MTRMRERGRGKYETRAATKWQKCNRSAQKLTVAAAVTTTTTTTTARVIPEMATEWPKKGAKKQQRGWGRAREKKKRSECHVKSLSMHAAYF